MGIDLIEKYFPALTESQRSRFEALDALYHEWNDKINVISRKDINNLYERHVLHSLAIAAFLGVLVPGTRFVDVGTGGGFPAVPLAILYPDATFHLVDRIGKKLQVAREISGALGLENVSFQHGDMAECKQQFDYAVSRAVMPLNRLVAIVRRNIVSGNANRYANGLVCLKGGDLADESQGIKRPVIEFPISEFFNETFFDSKKIVYVPFS